MSSSVEEKKQEIANQIKSHRVMLYMKGTKDAPMCGFSSQVVQILMHLGVDFETRDVLSDEALRQAIKDFSDWPTIPQLYIDGEFIGGCDITTELFHSGELQNILGTH